MKEKRERTVDCETDMAAPGSVAAPEPMTASPVAGTVSLMLAVLLLAWLVLPGIKWGLPSAERNRLTLGEDRAAWRAPAVAADETADPWRYYPNFLQGGAPRTGALPRSAFNPVRSYHPDEYVFFKSLSAMRPGQWRLFHGFFGWPALQFYVVGASLKIASWLGVVELVPDLDFYFENPEAMARLYVVGRMVTFLFAVGCLVLVWRAATRLFGPAGGAAAPLFLAATPLFVVNTHYLTADVPMLFWLSLVLLSSAHILSGGGRKWYALAGVALGLAAATRYQGCLGALLIVLARLFSATGTSEGWVSRLRKALGDRNLWIAAGMSILVFLVCNPFIIVRPGQFVQEFVGELQGAKLPVKEFALQALLFAETGFGVVLVAAAMGALGLAAVVGRRDRAVWLVTLGFGVPAAMLLAGRPAMVRYLMPVMLLPVLLTAWGFARFYERGLATRRRGASWIVPALLAAPLLLTLFQSAALAAMFVHPRFDTRTVAGEWISRNVPAGARIGVLSEPWQFELPPLDARKYCLMVVAGKHPGSGSLEYVVLSDYQVGFASTLLGDPTPVCGAPCTVVARFAAWPLGQREFLAHGPHDMRYVNPVVVIARCTENPKP